MLPVPRIAMVALGVLIALLGALGFRDYTHSPYTGIQQNNLVIRAIEAASPNRGSGLAVGDRIVAVNGVAPRNLVHYEYLVESNRARHPFVFTIERGGRRFDATVRTGDQPMPNVVGKIALLIVAHTFVFAGLVVMAKRPDILGSLFTASCYGFSFLMTERPVASSPFLHITGELAYDFVFIFIPAFILHFFLLFPGREIERGTRRAALVRFLYVPPALLSLATFATALGRYSAADVSRLAGLANALNAASALYWLAYVALSLAVFARTYRVSGKAQRLKFRVAMVGVALGVAPLTVVMLIKQFQPSGEVPARHLWALFLSFMPVSFAYAILKHHAFDVGNVLRRSLVYAMVLVLVIVLYGTFIITMGDLVKEVFRSQAALATGAALVVLALAFVPARSGIQALVDRAFARNRQVFTEEVISFNRGIQHLRSLDEIAAFATGEMCAMFQAEHAHLFLREDTGNFILRASAPVERRMPLTSFPPGTDLIALMSEERLPLMLEYYDRLWIKNNLDRISRELVSIAQAAVSLPLIEQDELMGFLLLGRKGSGRPYSPADAEILELLGERSAVALRNVRLSRDSFEKERLGEELRLASDIQSRLLPASPPSLAHTAIAGGIRTSREVGGDFYDYVSFGPAAVGLAVADVSGKGIPAALLMTTIQASFRAEALPARSPATVVTALNKSLYERSDPEKFATFFYAMYDDGTGILTYCNAGSYPPFILSADGRINRLQRGGVLMGIEPDSAYREGILKLREGDLLVVYTDGFIDQEGADEEPFGEERLLDFFRNNRSLPVESVLEKLFATVIAFGGSNLKDDMTIVLLRRNSS